MLSNAGVNTQADAYGTALNGGTIEVYAVGSGVPANADVAITDQPLLGVATLGSPAFGAAVAGVQTANAITPDSSANATGNAAFARVKTSGGAVYEQLTVSVSGGGGQLILNRLDITAGGELGITSYVRTIPKT